MKAIQGVKLQRWNTDQWLPGTGMGGGPSADGPGSSYSVMAMLQNGIAEMAAQLCAVTKIYLAAT